MAKDDTRLIVSLEARVSDFQRKLDAAEKRADKAMKKIEKASDRAGAEIGRELAKGGAAGERALANLARNGGGHLRDLTSNLTAMRGAFAGAFAAAGVGEFMSRIKDATAAVAEMNKEAQVAGLGPKTFQEFGYVARRFRISQDALVDGFKELSLRADEFAVTGKGSAQEAFERLGYSAEQVGQKIKDPVRFFDEIIGKLKEFDRAAQIRILDELFGGTGGEQFVVLLNQVKGSLADVRQRAHEVGAVLDDELIAKAIVLDQRIADVSTTIQTRMKAAFVEAGTAAFAIVDAMDAALSKLDAWGDKLGNSSFWERINVWAGANGLMTVPSGMTLNAGPVADAARGGAIARQQSEVERLTKELEQADHYASLPESDMGITGLRVANENAAALRAELEKANAELSRLQAGAGGPFSISVNGAQTVGPNLPASIGNIGIGVGGPDPDGTKLAPLADNFEGALRQMIADAKAAGHNITVNSGYRSNERQAELFAAAVAKYGSEAAARKWVAPPGRSMHNKGLAGDLAYSSDAARQWAHANAANYGLNFPMSHEPWHVEPVGARGSAAPAPTAAPAANRAAAAAAAQREADAIKRVVQNLEFEAQQRQRSTVDQEVHAALREAGIELTSTEGQRIAELVTARFNHEQAIDAESAALERQKQAQEQASQAQQQLQQQLSTAVAGSLTGFLQDLRNGVSAADALRNALTRLADQLISMAVNSAINGLFGGLFGDGLFGFKDGGAIPTFATGGRISGPGTGTSDSIIARVSAGEHVIRASQARKHRALLEAINSGAIDRLPAFRDGGAVGGSSAAFAGGGVGGNQTNTFNITVESKSTGDPVADQKAAKAMAEAMKAELRSLMVSEIMQQQRSGGILDRRRR